MAWFTNYYWCERCDGVWTDEWSCMCDDDCPHCGARHMSPFASDDLTEIVVPRGGGYVVLRSPPEAEHHPDYEEVAEFGTGIGALAPTVPTQPPLPLSPRG